MYLTISIIVLIAIVCLIVFHWRKKKIICKICCMSDMHKCRLLNELVEPLGYNYYSKQDIFSSRLDAWQKDFGYGAIYDRGAPYFNMVFDSYPVYFDHDGKTWLIEFWKGQYGINTGAEIGIYHADRLLSEAEYQVAHFSAADEHETLSCSLHLCMADDTYVQLSEKHWWLTAFLPGVFSRPGDLRLKAALYFPNEEMLNAFYNGLCKAEYPAEQITIQNLCLSFTFHRPMPVHYGLFTRFHRRFSQCLNRMYCRLFVWITRPFLCTEDRVLYLYFYLPFCFRRLMRMHRFHRRCHRKNGCRRPKYCRRCHPHHHKEV